MTATMMIKLVIKMRNARTRESAAAKARSEVCPRGFWALERRHPAHPNRMTGMTRRNQEAHCGKAALVCGSHQRVQGMRAIPRTKRQ